jgi:hypothetical protein
VTSPPRYIEIRPRISNGYKKNNVKLDFQHIPSRSHIWRQMSQEKKNAPLQCVTCLVTYQM